jgi:hypothetical protein
MRLKGRFVLVSAVASMLALGVSGCGSDAAARNAKVVGLVRLCGGPGPGCFTEAVQLSVETDPGRKVVVREHLSRRSRGHFSFDLRPGVYTVSATNGGQAVGTTTVRATANRTARADITDGDVS